MARRSDQRRRQAAGILTTVGFPSRPEIKQNFPNIEILFYQHTGIATLHGNLMQAQIVTAAIFRAGGWLY
jgi:hypothetical protein